MKTTVTPFYQNEEITLVEKVKQGFLFIKQNLIALFQEVKSFGISHEMDDYEKRKLSIFNLLNLLQLIAGILIPLFGIINTSKLPYMAWLVLGLPALVSIVVLYFNYKKKHSAAYLAYFIFYPFVTCFIYMYGMNPGTTHFFILYGILSVFFLKDTGYMIFSLCFSMVSYYFLAVVINHFPFELKNINFTLYSLNQLTGILFIFFGLYVIKKENTGYQREILKNNDKLLEKNTLIIEQSHKMEKDAERLKSQTKKLQELDVVKNKMFSVISHDLKSPIYAIRNVFTNVQENIMSIEDLVKAMPDIQNDMNYTVSLMENLLQWAKSQMETNSVSLQKVDVKQSIQEVIQQLHLQAKAKQITIIEETPVSMYSLADKDMISVILRNLLSNAIKFTPEKGSITIGAIDHFSYIEVFVKDKGAGISSEALKEIKSNKFYSTNGTSSESGTGLGLMLCKEFLERNSSNLEIESEPGNGSTFSFSLKKTA